MNSKLEVSAKPDGTKKWYEGNVENVKYENGVRLLQVETLPLPHNYLVLLLYA